MNFFDKMNELTNVQLNDVQKSAVRYTDGPLLLLASPGSGKTTTLNMKIGYLLLVKKVPAHKILAITFSKASAKDMEERFESFFHRLTNERVHFSTIHSFAYQVVREFFQREMIQFSLLEGKDASPNKRQLLRSIFIEQKSTQPTEDEMDELMTYISFVKNKMIPKAELKKIDCSVHGADKIYEKYEAYKRQNDGHLLLDFDDMLTECLAILNNDEMLRHKYQQRFEYVLTDESQDNSVIQHRIVRILSAPQNNLCVVADDDQSIFMWRGSDVQELLNFKKIYDNGKIVTMAQNYRSTKEIVDTANIFIKRNKARFNKKMFTENPSGTAPIIHNMRTYTMQLNYVVDEIRNAPNPKETAILYRNNASAIRLIDLLEKEDIPFYMKDVDVKFFKHWIVADVLDFMRLSYNDAREDVFERIYTKMNTYIKKNQMMKAMQQSDRKTSIFDLILKNIHAPYQEQALRKAKKTVEMMNAMKPKEAIECIRQDLGYEKSLKRTAEHLGFNEERLLSTLSQLEHIAEGLPDLAAFAKRLKDLEEIMRTSRFNKGENVVTLSTLHSSKGLEFDRVYMIDLVDGIIPAKDDLKEYEDDRPEKMEEAVRLFYVGMTRARNHLELLTYNDKDSEKMYPSVFLEDVKHILNGEEVGEIIVRKDMVDPPTTIPKDIVTNKKFQQKKKVRNKPVDAIEQRTELIVGQVVRHHLYERGTIKNVDGDEIEIVFEHYGDKRFSVDYCLQNAMLRKG